MERVARGFDTEPIQRGLDRIPPRILELVGGVDFLCGTDPIFAGLHRSETVKATAYYPLDVSLRRCTHLSLPQWQPRLSRSSRVPTIVVPLPLEEVYGEEGRAGAVVAHEYGHVLDHLTGQGSWPGAWEVGIVPVSALAWINWGEAFAEAFEAWLFPEFYPDAAAILHDSPILALFEELAR